MPSEMSAIKFIEADFHGPWKRSLLPDAVFEYVSLEDSATLVVVSDPTTAAPKTYSFRLRPDDIVYVSGQVIHVSARLQQDSPRISGKTRGKRRSRR